MKNSIVKFENRFPAKSNQNMTVIDVDGKVISLTKKPKFALYALYVLIGFLIVFIPIQYDSYVTKQKIEKIKKEIETNGRANKYAE